MKNEKAVPWPSAIWFFYHSSFPVRRTPFLRALVRITGSTMGVEAPAWRGLPNELALNCNPVRFTNSYTTQSNPTEGCRLVESLNNRRHRLLALMLHFMEKESPS
jgi:hypothetical protein